MAILIELSPETESAVREHAEAQGKDAAQLLRKMVEEAFPARLAEAPAGDDERPSLAELYAGQFGRIDGSSEPFSEDTGHRFTEYVTQKYREGRL